MIRKAEEAKRILKALMVPEKQQSELCCLVLLALSSVKKSDPWKEAEGNWMRIHDIIAFLKKNYGVSYAENSRETIRKQALHHFRNAAFIEDNGRATNSPKYMYRLTQEALMVIRSFRTSEWEKTVKNFFEMHESLIKKYSSKREALRMQISVNDQTYGFSTGDHNLLLKEILENFIPRFASGSECLYIGDTANKELVKLSEKLGALGLEITSHGKMPDVVLYSAEHSWIYYIEAVTSVGPIDNKRLLEMKEMSSKVKGGIIYITAFLDFKTYKKFSAQLAWETEVWIAEMPDHMIHLNGNKFLGPRD